MVRFASIALLISFTGWWQSLTAYDGYDFEVSSEDYSPLEKGTVLNTTPWGEWHAYPNVPIGFDFAYFDESFSRFKLEVSSRMVFDANHQYFFDPLAMVHLADGGHGVSKSIIRHLTEGTPGQRVFVLEYRNVRLKSDTSKRVSFQARLYEEDGQLSFHMGPANTSATAPLTLGPYSGVYHLKSVSPVDFAFGLNATGKGSTTNAQTFKGTGVPYLNYRLAEIPSEGTVFRFTPQISSNAAHPAQQLVVEWQAAQHTLSVHDVHPARVLIYSSTGRLVEQRPPAARHVLMHLPKGLYFIQYKQRVFKILL